jgi:spermidine dehydrogenase
MFRDISRRDFLQGTALALAAPSWARAQSPVVPPSGFQGQDEVSTARGHRVRDGLYRQLPSGVVDTGESYDLVVVGAGLAGLAAAHVYKKERGGNARILLLENNDDFGGHARRNTFEWNGTTLIVNGGTYDLEAPEDSPPEALEILDDIGIRAERLLEFRDPGYRTRFGLASTCFFDPDVFRSVKKKQFVPGFHEIAWERFLAKTPLSEPERQEILTLYTTRENYLAGEAEPEKALASMTWESYIRDKMRLGDTAVLFSDLYATDLAGLGCDALPATYGHEVGPGFFGVGGDGFYDDDGMLRYSYEPIHRFPDGNRSVARQLLKKIIPDAITGEDSMEGVFNGKVLYHRLDTTDGNVRLRLRSTVVRVEHTDGGSRVAVSYATPGGEVRSVAAAGVVVAAWGMVAKHIVPELSEEQRDALEGYGYCSALYINVLLDQWRPIAEAGAFEMYMPGRYATWMHVLDPLHVGAYQPEHHPDKPTVLSMFRYLRKPGLPIDEQLKLNRYELEAKSFEEIEREIRTELDHVLGPFGFDPARDIKAITVNRWGHGYIVFPHPDVERPHRLRGRERTGRISFAGADAAGTPWTQGAFREAHRAAHEQLSR